MTGRAALAALAVAALALAGCGGHGRPASTTAASPAPVEPPTPRTFRVALVLGPATELRVLAGQGLQRAVRELGIEGRVVMSHGGDDERVLARAARGGYDLVLAAGTTRKALDEVARDHPRVSFAVVDVSQESLPSRPRNVRGLLFEEREAGYLAGYLAGLVGKEAAAARRIVGSVGGRRTPEVERYIAGFQAGARAADPKVELLNAYTGGVGDRARCKVLALGQIARGAGAVFPVAGRCGLGALEAAGERSVWGIGVDVDRLSLGRHMLTSATKNADVAVFLTIQAARDGRFAGGEDVVFDVASGGVGLGAISPLVAPELVVRVKQAQAALAAGRAADIPETPRTP